MCPDCELKNQIAQITPDSILSQVNNMEYVEGFSADSELFDKRMSVCSECPSFISKMMCKENGAYPAFKAKLISGKCPLKKW